MYIKLAGKENKEHISNIWRACFSDDQDYIDNYLNHCLPLTKTLLLGIDKNNFVSCLSIIPSFTLLENQIYNGGYLYAVGTLPEHRGNSYSKILINAAIEESKKDGLSYMLVKPASESLYKFYIKSSFDQKLFKSNSTFIISSPNIKSESRAIITDLSASELFEFRKKSFSETHFLWPKGVLEYALIEARNRNGMCKKYQIASLESKTPYYFISYPDDIIRNQINVLETNASNPEEIEFLISILKEIYPETEQIKIETSSKQMSYTGHTIEKSALLLTFITKLTNSLEKLHLSLPLE